MRCWCRRGRCLQLLALLPVIAIVILSRSLLRYTSFVAGWEREEASGDVASSLARLCARSSS